MYIFYLALMLPKKLKLANLPKIWIQTFTLIQNKACVCVGGGGGLIK